MRGRPDIYLVIKNEKIMSMFIKLLIYKMKTIDGTRNTMDKFVDSILKRELSHRPNMTNIEQYEIKLKLENHLLNSVAYQYQLIKIRHKISYSAFMKNQTIVELWLTQIKRTYKQLVQTF